MKFRCFFCLFVFNFKSTQDRSRFLAVVKRKAFLFFFIFRNPLRKFEIFYEAFLEFNLEFESEFSNFLEVSNCVCLKVYSYKRKAKVICQMPMLSFCKLRIVVILFTPYISLKKNTVIRGGKKSYWLRFLRLIFEKVVDFLNSTSYMHT